MDEREFWLAIRQALLMLLDVIERRWSVQPRTSELRHLLRETRRTG